MDEEKQELEDRLIEKIAIAMHDAWREDRKKNKGWHEDGKCPISADDKTCVNCILAFAPDKKEFLGKEIWCDKRKEYHPVLEKHDDCLRCEKCHHCVGPWNTLTDDEKRDALRNARFPSTVLKIRFPLRFGRVR